MKPWLARITTKMPIILLVLLLLTLGNDVGVKTPVGTSIIVLNHPGKIDDLSVYQGLKGSRVSVSYLTREFDPSPEIAFMDSRSYPYSVMVATSGFPAFDGKTLYNLDMTALDAMAAKPRMRGFYFAEMLTYLASINSWNWAMADSSLNWQWVDQVMKIAQAHNKKVIWHEPSFAWQTLNGSATFKNYAATLAWKSVLIPMWANNFPDEQTENAQANATAVASRYNLPMGLSHQGWHWRDHNRVVTRQESFQIMWEARLDKARYFQLEGTPEDLQWGSPFMLGARDFAKTVSRRR